MKVGIVTFHRAINHGAVLQALALRKKVEDLGYQSIIIDYCPKGMLEQYNISPFKRNISLRGTVSNIIKYIPAKTKQKKFEDFRKKYFVTTSKLITE